MKEQIGGNKRPAILADSVEAVISAMYLDGGLQPVKQFILNNLKITKQYCKKNYKYMEMYILNIK